MSRDEAMGSEWVNTYTFEPGAQGKEHGCGVPEVLSMEGEWWCAPEVEFPFQKIVLDTSSIFPLGEEIGVKHDSGKPDYSLLPFHGLEEVVHVLTYGARKYSRDNWRQVEPHKERYTAAALRHLTAYARGEVTDPESGLHHLAHAVTSLLYILEKDMQRAK